MDLSGRGWMPVRIANDGSGIVDWMYTEGVAFDDPFFDETVQRAQRNPFRLLVRRSSSLDQVEELAGSRARDPDGIVLHVSRCGSTLLASALRARAGTRVLSEPGPVETVLATVHDRDAAVAALRAVIRSMAPDDPECAYVVKLDAWSTLAADLVTEAFPAVPWVLLHRDPAEVLVSLQLRRGFHAIPGALDPSRLELTREQVAGMGLDEYAATVIGRIMARGAEAARRAGSRALVLDYSALPEPGFAQAAAHFGLDLTDADRRRMAAVAGHDAKNPVLPWTDDSDRKRQAVTPELQRLADEAAGDARRELAASGDAHRAGA